MMASLASAITDALMGSLFASACLIAAAVGMDVDDE